MADEFFKLLGRIEVDNDALRKSLGESESLVRESGKRLQRIWNEGVTPERAEGAQDNIRTQGDKHGVLSVGGQYSRLSASVFSQEGQRALMARKLAELGRRRAGAEPEDGGGGDRGGFGGLAKGAESAHAQFTHLTRITQGLLQGPLGQLSPALSQAASAASFAGRAAGGMGVAIGAATIAAVLAAQALAALIATTKELIATNTDAKRSIDTLDYGRAEAGIKKATEALAVHAETLKAGTLDKFGEVGAGQLVQDWEKFSDFWSGWSRKQLAATEVHAKAQREVFARYEQPKAIIETRKQELAIEIQAAQRGIANAQSQRELGAAYDLVATKSKARVQTEREGIQLDYDKAKSTAEKDAALRGGIGLVEAMATINLDFNNKNKILNQQAAEDDQKRVEEKAKALAQTQALQETYVQKDIKRNQDRVANAAAAASSIASSELQVANLQRAKFGLVESEAQLEKRLEGDRQAAITPLLSGIQASNDAYASQKRALQELINTNQAGADASEKMAELEKANAQEVADLNQKLLTERIRLDAAAQQAREQRIQAEIQAEEKAFAQRTAMGRVSQTDAMSDARLRAVDPRRSLDQQRQAEQEFQSLRISYAQNYFKLYESLGVPTYTAQLQWAKQIASEQVSGSEKWFAAVQNVANVYQQIHDKAKGLFATQASIAEAEAKRQGRTEIRPDQVGQYFAQAQTRANRKRAGAAGTGLGLGDMLGIIEAGQQARQDQRNPGELLAEALKNPAEELARTIGDFSTSIGTASITSKEGNEAMGNLAGGAAQATKALEELANAASRAAGTMGQSGTGGQASADTDRSRGSGVLESAAGGTFSMVAGRTMYNELKRGPVGGGE